MRLTRRGLFQAAGAGAAACVLPAPQAVTLPLYRGPGSLEAAILLCNELKRSINNLNFASVMTDAGRLTIYVPRARTSEPDHQD